MSADNRRGRVRAARRELFVGAGTCEEVDKIRGRSARSRTVPGRTRTRAWPRRTGREPVERFALRRVCGDFKAPAPAHRTRPPPEKRRPGTLGGGTTRRDHGARGPHQPPPPPNRHRVANNRRMPGPVADSPIPADSCANSEMAARRARRSVLVRLFAIGTVGCAALRTAAGPERSAVVISTAPLSLDRATEQVEGMIHRGWAFARVEDAIDTARLSQLHKGALWLLAWSLREDRKST